MHGEFVKLVETALMVEGVQAIANSKELVNRVQKLLTDPTANSKFYSAFLTGSLLKDKTQVEDKDIQNILGIISSKDPVVVNDKRDPLKTLDTFVGQAAKQIAEQLTLNLSDVTKQKLQKALHTQDEEDIKKYVVKVIKLILGVNDVTRVGEDFGKMTFRIAPELMTLITNFAETFVNNL